MYLRNYIPFDPSKNFEIEFPEEIIVAPRACILNRGEKMDEFEILNNIIVSADKLSLLDNVELELYFNRSYSQFFALVIELNYLDILNSPGDIATHIVRSYSEKLSNIIMDCLPQNCDVKNISGVIKDFYMGIDTKIEEYAYIHLIRVDSKGKFDIYSCNMVNNKCVFTIMDYPAMSNDCDYYLCILDRARVLSLSKKIEIDNRFDIYIEKRIKLEEKRTKKILKQ